MLYNYYFIIVYLLFTTCFLRIFIHVLYVLYALIILLHR